MTVPTPSPRSSDDRLRPAALGVMAQAVSEHVSSLGGVSLHIEVAECVVLGALKAASDAGMVLIPRAELEEAAEMLIAVLDSPDPAALKVLAKLRERSRQ